MRLKLAPSLLSADFANLEKEINDVVEAGADYIHLDVMDGVFVPNITIGAPVIRSLRKRSDAVFDTHLMIKEPDKYIDAFANAGADIITVHVEACPDIGTTIAKIKSLGKRAGVTLKPATPVDAVLGVLPFCDLVLVMSVEPGFGGQTLIRETLEKVRALKKIIVSNGYHAEIEIDGGVTLDNIDEILECGADVIVAGDAVFGRECPHKAVLEFVSHFERFEARGNK